MLRGPPALAERQALLDRPEVPGHRAFRAPLDLLDPLDPLDPLVRLGLPDPSVRLDPWVRLGL